MIDNIIAKIILFPFSILYGFGVSIRNLLYDLGLLKSTSFNLPVISVGNLAIGGSGKTPHIEYLLVLLKDHINMAVLSRGYKRKTKGFRFVTMNDTANTVGDEPLQFRYKFRDVVISVSESRMTGVPNILKKYPQVQAVLLDDAFQHRAVVPGLNVLLTSFEKVYTQDLLLPAGRLREYPSSAERANIIIVTKCPPKLSEQEKQQFEKKINPLEGQKLFFSYYKYYDPYYLYDINRKISLNQDQKVILLAAIANTNYLEQYLELECNLTQTLKFEDHHYFNERDILTLTHVIDSIEDPNTIIITTEKDATRLDLFRTVLLEKKIPIYVLPISVAFHFDEKTIFDASVRDFLMNFKV